MPILESRLNSRSQSYCDNRTQMKALLAQLRALESRTRDTSAKSGSRFAARGQLLPHERVALLLDVGAPFIE
ncbi:MAG: acyl-CoA carboxylase subunit beta, partial [Burkholderiales bacterium]